MINPNQLGRKPFPASASQWMLVGLRGGPVNPGTSPDTIAGLRLWLKADTLALADGAAIATWPDSSGNGNDVVQANATNQPIFKTGIVNGKPVVRFDGANDYMGVTNTVTLAGDFTALVVYKRTSDAYIISNLAANYQFFAVTAANALTTYDGVTAVTSSTLATPATSWNSCCISRAAITVSFFESGVPRGTGSNSAPYQVNDIGSLLNLTWMNGDLAEVIVYNSSLSTTDRQGVEQYLRNKYAIP